MVEKVAVCAIEFGELGVDLIFQGAGRETEERSFLKEKTAARDRGSGTIASASGRDIHEVNGS